MFIAPTTLEKMVPDAFEKVTVMLPRAENVDELLNPEPVTLTVSPGIPRAGLTVMAGVMVNCALTVLGNMSCTIMKCGPAMASGIVTLML